MRREMKKSPLKSLLESLLILIVLFLLLFSISLLLALFVPPVPAAPAAADPGEAEFIVQAANAATRRSLTPVESAWLAKSYGHHDPTYRMARVLMEYGIIHQNKETWDSRIIALAYQLFTESGRREVELVRNIFRALPAAGPPGRDGRDGKDGAPGAPGAAGEPGKDGEPLGPVATVQPAPPTPAPPSPPPTPGVGGIPSVVQVTFIPARLTITPPSQAQATIVYRPSIWEGVWLPLAALLGRPRYNTVWSPSTTATTGAVTATGGAGGAGYGAAAVAAVATSTAATPTSAAHAEQGSAASSAGGN